MRMRMIDGALRLSASDLMRFKGCRHATTLDLRMMEVRDLEPADDGAEAELLQRQGDAHEFAFLDELKGEGRSVIEIPKDGLSLEASVGLTHEAMAAGPDVVFQGALLGGAWGGYSDFLERVERPSALGGWSYEVVDTKLKRKPDPKHVLQLCALLRPAGRGAGRDTRGSAPPARRRQSFHRPARRRLGLRSPRTAHAGGIPGRTARDAARASGRLPAVPLARALRRAVGA